MTTHLTRLLSCVALLLLIATAAIAQPSITGNVKTLKLKSAVLGEERTILVRTPIGYEANKVSYPVLYMTDGDAHMGHTAATIDFLTRNGRVSDLIVVGVTNTDRTRDLTPTKSTNKNAAGELQFPTSGGSDNFLKFFETEPVSHSRRTLARRALRNPRDDQQAWTLQFLRRGQSFAAMGKR
jgi:hypothetical protein